MSGSRRNAAPVVSREYRNAPDDCVRALEVLLKKPVNKADKPAPEPVGRDGTTRIQGDDSASAILPN